MVIFNKPIWNMKDPVLKKVVKIILFGTAGWIIVSETKIYLMGAGFDRIWLLVIAVIFLIIGFELVGNEIKY